MSLKKIILISLAFILIFPQFVFAEENPEVHLCRTEWNDQMQIVDEEYVTGLNSTLFQKMRTSAIIDSGLISQNLRSHNCKMYQICEVVQRSLFPNKENPNDQLVTGKFMRCQDTPISKFGGVFPSCNDTEISGQNSTFNLWTNCMEQAEERIQKIEDLTETEIIKSNSAKTTSNLVGYLMELNKKLDKLSMDIGDMIGVLFDVTRKMTCVQKSCH